MITKQDCMMILSEMGETEKLKELVTMDIPSIELLEYINDRRELDLTKFYEKIRKSYNQKKSKLYINIVKEIDDTAEVLTTLSALLTQILIYSKTAEDKNLFLRAARAAEIAAVLKNYFITFDITNCLKLARIIKADVKICDYLSRK